MALAISTLVPFLRMGIDDNDGSLQEFTDSELVDYLRFSILTQEASWNQGYSVVYDTDHYDIEPSPNSWLQMLYVIKACIMIKTFQEKFSYDNKVMKVTRTSKSEDLKALNQIYQEIIDERKNSCVGYSYNSFDDYFTRYYNILDEINEGYR
jgi:hypothetical protein